VKHATKILDFAMKMELEARDFYLDSLQKVSRPETKSLLENLAEWERGHYNYLKKQLDHIIDSGRWDTEAGDLSETEGKGIIEGLSRGSVASPSPGELSSDFSVLRMAMALETDFRTFYSRAAEKTSNAGGKRILLMLADWEGGHQEMIEEQYKSLQEEFRSEMGFEPF